MSNTKELNDFLLKMASIEVTHVVAFEENLVGDLFIGCGRWPAADEKPPQDRLLLNNKGTRTRFGRDFSSVSRLVASPPTGLLESWSLWGLRPIEPQAALERIKLVAEDASPDSVFALLILLATLSGIDARNFPTAWLDAVDLWEREGVSEDPRLSWCPLQAALGHSHFPVGSRMTREGLSKAWTDGLRFAVHCLLYNYPPHAIPESADFEQCREAREALDQERQVYLDWLPHATALQLLVPLDIAQDRRILVDALIFVEDQSTGAAKVFYRNDKERSPLKKGFSFSAHYRPAEQGTGNDITITVDPRRGVQLKDLWNELESKETEAWKDQPRPNDPSRPLEAVESHWTEPWYINANATLIGAPRRLTNGELGTKLKWSDVFDAIWTVYDPLRDVKVCSYGSNEPISLSQLVPEKDFGSIPADSSAGHHKCILLARWPQPIQTETGGVGPRSLTEAPIVPRVLAAMVNRGYSSKSIGLHDLPVQGSWEKITLSAGFAVVTDHGVFVLDDWTPQHLAQHEILDAFNEAVALELGLNQFEDHRLKKELMKDVHKVLGLGGNTEKPTGAAQRSGPHWRAVEDLLRDIARAGAELARLRGDHARVPQDMDARLLFDALDRRWKFELRLKYLEQQIRSLETSLRSISEMRTLGATRLATIYAFPIILAGGLADPLARMIWWAVGLFRSCPAVRPEAPAWFAFASFWLIAIPMILILKRIMSREYPLRSNKA
jgi:hypothetical protein